MTTIVYKEEMITSTASSGAPRNVSSKMVTVQILSEDGRGSGSRASGSGGPSSTTPRHSASHSSRGGSPKPNKLHNVRGGSKLGKGSFTTGYASLPFTITAYLPYDGGKRLKLQCLPGQSVQKVIESEIPELSQMGYQVYQYPSRALLNPEKDASVLQDQEISIEPMRSASPVDETGDDRLGIVKELLRTEDTYLENLRNIFDIYMEPLKKYGLPQSEMNTMFRSLSRLCDLLMNFFSELEQCVKHWNKGTTLIGGLFKQYQSFWEMYSEYSTSYTKACKLLKQKRGMDSSFNRFLEMKRGAAMHTLESLMLLPVQRIYEYHKILMRLYSLTPKDHPDYHDLRYTITRVSQMVKAREHQLNQTQNEQKLEQVQTRFPNDNLGLFQPLEVIAVHSGAKRKSNRSSSSGPMHIRQMKTPPQVWSTPTITSPPPQDETDSKHKVRLYLSEGPVKVLSAHGLQAHDRHLFLFDDLLIISKPVKHKSQHKEFKRKVQVRLSEVWVAECQDKSLETVLIPDTYFILGWPFTNYLASFTTPEEKTMWLTLLTKYTAAQRKSYDKMSVQVLNLTNSSNPTPCWVSITGKDQSRDLLRKAVEAMNIAVSESNCQFLVKVSKDEVMQLVGHEYPYAIQTFHNRHRLEFSDKIFQLQFVIKRKEPPQMLTSSKQLKKSKISSIFHRTRNTRSSKTPRVFGAPLDMVIVNNELPDILQEILVRLFTEGPTTRGIFRQSAKYTRVQYLMDCIDKRVQVKLYDCTIHEVGALLKTLLRNVPGGILQSSRYTELVATNDCADPETRIQQIQKVVFRLPNENQLFLRYVMPLLHHISQSSDVNGMTSVNLAICFAPSMLWPSSGLDVIKNEVPPLIQFFIEHCPDIFGAELPVLYKQAELPPSPVENMEMEFTISAPTTKQFVPTKVDDGAKKFLSGHKRSDSIDSSISEESASADIDDEHHNSHRHNFRHNNVEAGNTNSLLRARTSGLTVSDSQLSHISQMDEYAPSNQSSNNSFETNSSSSSKQRQVRKRGTIVTSGQHIHHPDSFANGGGVGIGGGFPAGVEKPSPKRIKKGRVPERSSSLHGPNDMVYRRLSKNSRTTSTVVPPPCSIRPITDNTQHRRKSIATQELLQSRDFMMPSSSNSSFGSSSHGYSPKMMQRIQQSKDLYARRDPSHSKSGLRRHAHSFTCKDVERPVRTIPASSSFYDTLSPLEVDELRPSLVARTRVDESGDPHSSGKYHMRLDVPNSTKDEHHSRPILTNVPSSYAGNGSPQTYANSATGRAGPTGGSGYSDTSDILRQGSKVDGEFLKVAISERYNLGGAASGIGIPPPSTPSSASSTSTSTFNTLDNRVIVGVHEATPTREDILYTPAGSESGQDSLERVQKKLQDRKRPENDDVSDTPTTFSSSTSYRGFLNAQQQGDSLMSLTEESGIDDRPECDIHLESLPHQVGGHSIGAVSGASAAIGGAIGGSGTTRNLTLEVTMSHHDQDPVRVINNGYNSDTESAPSRTLSRPDKIKEVSSPVKMNLPSRYHHGTGMAGPHTYDVGGSKRHHSTYQKHAQPQARQQQQQQQQQPVLQDSTTSTTKDHTSNLVQSLPADFSMSVSAATAADPPPSSMTTTTLYSSSSSSTSSQAPSPSTSHGSRSSSVKASSGRHRPKSGDSRVERLTEMYRANERTTEKDRLDADIEFAKVKLGLIPQQVAQPPSPSPPSRQRSKSTSEKEAMKILHKLMGEEESTAAGSTSFSAAAGAVATTTVENRPSSQEDDRASKHKQWLSSAPTSAERREAWESQASGKKPPSSSSSSSSSPSQFHRNDKSRSLRISNMDAPHGTGDKVPVTTVTTTTRMVSRTPEVKRKCATLPDMLNGKQTKMVKVRTYEIPEVQRIRRINLRTYH